MTPPRSIRPDQLCFVTVRAVNRAFRFAPSPEALEIIRYCLTFTLSKYRGRIAIHELLWMSNHFHLVVTDYNLPRLDGAALARHMRASRPDLPVLLMSGLIDGRLQEEAATLEIEAIVPKPFGVEELAAAAARALEGRRVGNGSA